ncbi:MAG: DUF4125 family protein [Oscillospiraceae bacterium]|nr:DUF4125 family protein [Oscillospiraceae bacterium]
MESILHDNPNAEIIRNIISTEWDMFDKVCNLGGRAACQDDSATFFIMRCSQFLPWEKAVLQSYEEDLKKAKETGENLVEMKYAYMMSFDDPEYFDKYLASDMPATGEEKKAAANAAMDMILKGFREAAEEYPAFTRLGRPESGSRKDNAGTSFEVYMRSELLTYSEKTLGLFLEMIKNKIESHVNFACEIYENTAKFYGFASLEEAESVIEYNSSRSPE